MNKEIITKLLKSSNPDDNLLGLELQYQAFRHGYTNWYKRHKYSKEFIKRILTYTQKEDYVNLDKIQTWFKARLEEDFKDNML